MIDLDWRFGDRIITTPTLHESTFEYQPLAAYQVGRCKRQLYISKLGYADTVAFHGRFKTGIILMQQLTKEIAKQNPHLNDIATKTAVYVGPE